MLILYLYYILLILNIHKKIYQIFKSHHQYYDILSFLFSKMSTFDSLKTPQINKIKFFLPQKKDYFFLGSNIYDVVPFFFIFLMLLLPKFVLLFLYYFCCSLLIFIIFTLILLFYIMYTVYFEKKKKINKKKKEKEFHFFWKYGLNHNHIIVSIHNIVLTSFYFISFSFSFSFYFVSEIHNFNFFFFILHIPFLPQFILYNKLINTFSFFVWCVLFLFCAPPT